MPSCPACPEWRKDCREDVQTALTLIEKNEFFGGDARLEIERIGNFYRVANIFAEDAEFPGQLLAAAPRSRASQCTAGR
jgi:hypothetical protein